MAKVKCHICKKSNTDSVCSRCGAHIGDTASERLVLATSGAILYNDDAGKYVDKFSYCKMAMTDRRLIIYNIKPDSDNPAWWFFRSIKNLFEKFPCISINLNDIEQVRRYREWFAVKSKTGTYSICVSKQKELDQLFTPYKDPEEQ